ncbi:MAG: hypothetical protein KGO05_06290 [Chloroflexota bacterium]|nr:hypothetical protein [Chloroflexota bacterium]
MSDDSIQRDEAAPDGAGAKAERAARESRYEGATPPGYDEWPTHGGYLGCLLGVMTACVLAPLGYIIFGFLGSLLAPSLGKFGVGLAAVVTVALYLAVFIGIARLGWTLGRRFLREYDEPARPRWGEASSADYPLVVEADPAPVTEAHAEAPGAQDADAAQANPDAAPAE